MKASAKLVLFFSIFLFSGLSFSFAQTPEKGIPVMQHYSKNDYGGGRQNWQILQDKTGFIYFANNSGVVQFDGHNSRLIPVSNFSVVRSLAMDEEGTIYVGASEEFGFLQPDKIGRFSYCSLGDKIPENIQEFGEIWGIFPTEQGVFFASFTHIFLLRDDEIEIVSDNRQLFLSFQTEKELLFQKRNGGLLRLENNELITVEPDDDFRQIGNVWAVLPFGEKSKIIGTEKNGLFLWSEGELENFNCPASDFLKRYQLYSSAVLDNGKFVFGTVQNGLIITDKSGRILRHINKGNGLTNNTILSVYQDQSGILWLGLDNGITALFINSPISLCGVESGVAGAGYASLSEEDYSYMGTNQGLFASEMKASKTPVEMIPGTDGQVWDIQDLNGIIVCTHNKGVFQISGKTARIINQRVGAWTFIQLKDSKNQYVCGTYEGLDLYETINGKLRFIKKIKGFDESCRDIYEGTEGEIWVSHGYKGVFKLIANPERDSIISYKLYTSEDGLPSDYENALFRFRGAKGVASRNGIYTYNADIDAFERNYKYNDLFRNLPVYKAFEDIKGNIWLFLKEGIAVLQKTDKKSYRLIHSPIGTFENLLIHSFQHISEKNNGDLLIAYENGFINIDINRFPETMQKGKVFIRKIEIRKQSGDSCVYFADKPTDRSKYLREPLSLEYDENHIRIFFTDLICLSRQKHVYRCKLEGYDDDWIWPEKNGFVDYSNLPPGKYTFRVKSLSPFESERTEDSLLIRISAPWYLSKPAYLTYFLLFLAFAFLLFRYTKYKITRDRKRLELDKKRELEQQKARYRNEALRSEKELIKLRNEKLRAKIESREKETELKNRELSLVTMQITHKNSILSKLKEKIEKLSRDAEPKVRKELRSFIMTIDDDINLDDDWQKFEQHFELVHEGFFKRLRENYPDLTPNDLKVCAYLRMNLTSKEISSLMNVSIRTVENTRYRLRKKLKLEKSTNLIRFIMEI